MSDNIKLLMLIAFLLAVILSRIINIDIRLKERFPTAKEQDRQWAKDDWEAHKDDKKDAK
jgi:hypothetical protein